MNIDDGLPVVGPDVDLTKITAINQKRTLAFLNHFISHTVRFLNQFSAVCEKKLSELSSRIQKVEITIGLLEAKLASIPGLENITVETPAPSAAPVETQQQAPVNDTQATLTPGTEPEPEPIQAAAPVMTVSKDPRYAKYFQMLKVGVPAVALKPKMIADGLDPDYIDTPDAPAPSGGGPVAQDSDDDDNDDDNSSVSSFSDDD